MKSKELREMTDDELRKELDNLAKGLFNLRFRKRGRRIWIHVFA